jgi:hypothetical protein
MSVFNSRFVYKGIYIDKKRLDDGRYHYTLYNVEGVDGPLIFKVKSGKFDPDKKIKETIKTRDYTSFKFDTDDLPPESDDIWTTNDMKKTYGKIWEQDPSLKEVLEELSTEIRPYVPPLPPRKPASASEASSSSSPAVVPASSSAPAVVPAEQGSTFNAQMKSMFDGSYYSPNPQFRPDNPDQIVDAIKKGNQLIELNLINTQPFALRASILGQSRGKLNVEKQLELLDDDSPITKITAQDLWEKSMLEVPADDPNRLSNIKSVYQSKLDNHLKDVKAHTKSQFEKIFKYKTSTGKVATTKQTIARLKKIQFK